MQDFFNQWLEDLIWRRKCHQHSLHKKQTKKNFQKPMKNIFNDNQTKRKI